MGNTMAMDVTALEAMTAGELDNVTELQARGDDGWQDIVTGVRDDVVEAAKEGRFDVARARDAVVHEIADSLVPPYTRDLVRHFSVIAAAWSVDLEEARQYLSLYSEWSNMTSSDDVESVVRLALYVAYRAAVLALVETLEETDDEDDADD